MHGTWVSEHKVAKSNLKPLEYVSGSLRSNFIVLENKK